ncbi:MAG: hypothetical protein IKU25_08265 [Clostridia bacterium]|nr:hypothetical protein [Clostridia bacterium]
MKHNFKFFIIVISLIILSIAIVVGGMHIIAANTGKRPNSPTAPDFNTPGGNANPPAVNLDTPATQDSLKVKFEAMYDVNGDTITVISENYLRNYWQDKDKIRSLTTKEVYFIIQDSIRIYSEYDTVILPSLEPFVKDEYYNASMRHPFGSDFRETVTIRTRPNQVISYNESDITAIYTIIMYRLKALSSPEAFFMGNEAIIHAGGIPELDSSLLSRTLFYIPAYSENTDRNHILSVVGSRTEATGDEGFSDLFTMYYWGEAEIKFASMQTWIISQAYPTAEIENNFNGTYIASSDGLQFIFTLDRNGKFTLKMNDDSSDELTGYYEMLDSGLLLYNADFRYSFDYVDGVGYRYRENISSPDPSYVFGDCTMFRISVSVGTELSGNVKFYTEATKERKEPVIATSIELSKDQIKELRKIIDSVQKWTDDDSVDRLPYYFDGEFKFSDRGYIYYFSYDANVIYFDHYCAVISDDQMQFIKNINQ